jgi:hypothetical protein
MDGDIFEGFCWHSSIGIDSNLDGQKVFVTRLPNNKQAKTMFTAAGGNLLVHKTTRCLWKLSDDKKTIEPVFSSDVLSMEEVKEAMEGSNES